MNKNLSNLLKGITALSLALSVAGCAAKEAPKTETPAETPQQEEAMEASEWSIQPKLGITKGDYFRVEERFRQGHLGILEVVMNGDEMVLVEFNELTRPNYYNRFFQNVPKRTSEYNYHMKAVKGAAWIESVLLVEKQMMESQSLTGEFEVISGASNSINQSMLPLAEKLSVLMAEPATEKYYEISEELGGGLTGRLQVTLKNQKITSVRYDEIFADSAEKIEAPAQKRYYGLSKYGSVEYDEPSRIGFNVQMDALNAKVVETQDLLDLSELPAIDETGNYASSGFTVRNGAWDNYLKLAKTLLDEMKADGNF